ncbi:MAG: efflux RND transporter periplasmic adaptor subunit [Treponema sp.]|nr:efflux RND transporter periplasmic adaptor subunit [Treponema sp.]MCL2272018.1 efflux RND transporter periplasmic adaptor subunit [Treponema sp.]
MILNKIKKIPPLKLGIFAGLTLLFLLVLVSVILRNNSGDDEFLAPVITIKPVYGNLEKTLRITSQVETGRLITLVPRVAGTLVMLDVKAGDEVEVDQIIAQVDSAPYDLTFLQARSQYMTARSTYDRIGQLYSSQGVSRQNYDEARMASEVARAQFEMAQLNLDYTNIRSPMNATVLMRHGTQGALVGAGTPLVTLGDLGDLRINAAIPEIHYRFFADNWERMPVRINAPALGEASYDLQPLSLAPYVSPENRSFIVEYEIPDGVQYGLRPGMFVNVIFTLEKRERIFFLPFKTLASGNRLWYVAEEGKAQYMELNPEFFNNEFFQIPSLYENMIFILEGQHFINQGQRVNILSGDTPQ